MYPSPLSIPQKRYPHSIGNNRKRHCPESIRRTRIERDAPLLYIFFFSYIFPITLRLFFCGEIDGKKHLLLVAPLNAVTQEKTHN